MKLSDLHQDAIAEIINMGVGRSAQSLNMMLADRILLEVPTVRLLESEELDEYRTRMSDDSLVLVFQSFSGGFNGRAGLVFPHDSAQNLVSALTGQEPTDAEMDAIRAGTLAEIGNIVLSGLFSSIGNYVGGKRFQFSIADFSEDAALLLRAHELEEENEGVYILAEVNFSFEHLSINGHIVLFLTVRSLQELISLIDAKLEG